MNEKNTMRMNGTTQRTPAVLAIIALAGVSAFGCGSSKEPAESPAVAQAEKAAGEAASHEARVIKLSDAAVTRAGIQLLTVQSAPLSASVLAPAELRLNAERVATVGPRVAGRVARIFVSIGQVVPATTVLASIDSPEVGVATAAYLTSEANREAARRTYEREKDLFAKKISAEREVLAAEAEFARASAELSAAETKLRTLDLTVDEIKATGSGPVLLAVRTPIAGTILDRSATLDAPVGPQDVLFKVANLSTLWLVANVPETAATNIRRGEAVAVTVDALPDEPVNGRVSYIASTVSAASRTVEVRIDVPNRDGRLKPGMFARARLASNAPANRNDNRILIPRSAVQELEGKTVVFLPGSPREYQVRTVTLGQAFGNDVEVLAGLRTGDKVVTVGSFTLKSQAVRGDVGEHD